MSSITFDNAFEEYFKLKNKYMKKYDKEKKKISKITDLNNNEKTEKLKQNLFCIKCKQQGGTLFQQKNNLLIAKCQATKPCKLDIQLERAIYKDVTNEINILDNKIITTKQDTILIKLNYLFNFTNDEKTKSDFTAIKQKFIELTNLYNSYLNYLNNIINNLDNKTNIKELNKMLDENIKLIKNNFNEFENTNNIEFIKENIDLHVNTIIPLVKKITKLTYPVNYIYKDDDNNLSYLIQNSYNYNELDIKINNTKDKIIIFNI
jgi:hypothetical protein